MGSGGRAFENEGVFRAASPPPQEAPRLDRSLHGRQTAICWAGQTRAPGGTDGQVRTLEPARQRAGEDSGERASDPEGVRSTGLTRVSHRLRLLLGGSGVLGDEPLGGLLLGRAGGSVGRVLAEVGGGAHARGRRARGVGRGHAGQGARRGATGRGEESRRRRGRTGGLNEGG